jgi:hypothetical protein
MPLCSKFARALTFQNVHCRPETPSAAGRLGAENRTRGGGGSDQASGEGSAGPGQQGRGRVAHGKAERGGACVLQEGGGGESATEEEECKSPSKSPSKSPARFQFPPAGLPPPLREMLLPSAHYQTRASARVVNYNAMNASCRDPCAIFFS